MQQTALKITATRDLAKETSWEQLPWTETDYDQLFGLGDFSADSFKAFGESLRDDLTKGREYAFRIRGVDLEDHSQM
jgi:hypothetical protein